MVSRRVAWGEVCRAAAPHPRLQSGFHDQPTVMPINIAALSGGADKACHFRTTPKARYKAQCARL